MPVFYDYATYLSGLFPEVDYRSFYRAVFPEGSLQRTRAARKGEYPAVAVVVREGGNLRHTVTDTLEAVDDIVSGARPGDLCVMSPVSYAGMTQRKSMAHALFALVFDIDGLKVVDGEPRGLDQLLYQAGPILDTAAANFAIPMPTYIVASGTGLHFYYVLDEPLVLWPSVLERVEAYRAFMTQRIWNRYASDLFESVQFEGATQGFRMVGTPVKPKAGDAVVRAFLTGSKVSVAYMDGFVPEEARIGRQKAEAERTPMAEAAEKWPEWHRRRIVEGVPRSSWRNKRDLYDWWKRRVYAEGAPGHRYNCIVALAAYARKCGIGRDELERDAEDLRAVLDSRDPLNPFTEKDVADALTAYRLGMVRYPIDEISKRTGIRIEKNKRNFRKQSQHLARARVLQDFDDPDGSWRYGNGGGRPTKQDQVEAYYAANPTATVREAAEALGMSKTTVQKWKPKSKGCFTLDNTL